MEEAGIDTRLTEKLYRLEKENQELRDLLQLQKGELELAAWGIILATWTWDFQTGKLTFADNKVKFLGYEPGELLPHIDSFKALIHPEDYEKLSKVMQEHVHNQSAFYEIEYRIKCKTGQWKWFYDKGKVIEWTSDQTPIKFAGVTSDITFQKEAENTAIQIQKNYHSLFDALKDMVFVVNDEGRIVYSNSAASEQLGYNSGELINKPILTIHPPNMQGEAARVFSEMKQGKEIRCDIPLIDAAGNTIPVESNVFTGYWDGRSAMFEISRDVSKLKLSEEKFEKAFRKNPVSMTISDLNTGVFVDANNVFLEKQNLKIEEVIGRTSLEMGLFFNPKDRERIILHIKQGKQVIGEEVLLRAGTGQPIKALFSAEKVHIGNQVCLLTSAVNISERLQTEMALRQSEAKSQALFNILPDMIFILDQFGIYLDYHASEKNKLAAPPEAFLGKSMYNVLPEELAIRFTEIFIKAFDTGEVQQLYYNLDIGGENRYFEARVMAFESEKILSIVRDLTDQRNTEMAMKKIDERFKLIAENTSDGLLVLENEKIEYASPAYSKIFEYTEADFDEFDKNGLYCNVHPEDREELIEKIKDAIKNKKSRLLYSYRSCNLKGTYTWREDHSQFQYDENGNYLRSYIVCRSIEERKKMEEALKESESRYKFASIATREGIWDWNLETNILNHNITWNTITGFEEKRASHSIQEFEKLIHPEDKEIFHEKVRESIGNNSPYSCEYRIKTQNNGYIWILDQGDIIERTAAGKPLRMIGSMRDITENKLTLERIKLLSKALEQSHAIVVITDSDGNIEYVNPQFTKTTGYSIDEVKGVNPRILKSGDHSSKFYEDLWLTIKHGKTWRGEFHNKKKNGEFYWDNTIISPMINHKNEITHFVSVKEDISEQKHLQQELIIAKRLAEESDRLKTAFLQNISHEIRTPLNGILGFSSLLSDTTLQKEKVSKYLDLIHTSGLRLLEIVDGIISVSMVESGLEQLFIKKVNISLVLNTLYRTHFSKLTNPDVSLNFVCELAEHENFILCDQSKLMLILTHLLNNANENTVEGKIEFGCKKINNMIEFYVKDTGRGIPKEFHDVIFKPFRKLNEDGSSNFSGTGIGLTIVKAYIELMGGNIWLESEEGRGTSFYFSIPYLIASED